MSSAIKATIHHQAAMARIDEIHRQAATRRPVDLPVESKRRQPGDRSGARLPRSLRAAPRRTSRVRALLTYGNVMATVAVFLAMSGAAVAVTTAPKNSVTSASIKDGEVRSADVRGGAVTAAKIAPSSVGSGKVVDGSLNSSDIRDDSLDQRDLAASGVGNTELADNSVGSSKIGAGEVTSTDISDSGILSQDIVGNQIGAREVKDLTTATSPVGTSISPGHAGNAQVTCPNGGMVVAGGYAWEDDAFTWVIYSTPSEADPTHTWMVRGYVPGGGNGNRLYAWANCLNA